LNKKIYSLKDLPRSVLLSLAQTSKDRELLKAIAHLACKFELDSNQDPVGVKYENDKQGRPKLVLFDQELFEVLGNNIACPDNYKLATVLIPGIQGTSPIVGEYASGSQTHIWEYLRADSYIPWGHYASNMAHDCVRYRAKELLPEDVTGLRHLYYQRVYTQMALNLNIAQGIARKDKNTLSYFTPTGSWLLSNSNLHAKCAMALRSSRSLDVWARDKRTDLGRSFREYIFLFEPFKHPFNRSFSNGEGLSDSSSHLVNLNCSGHFENCLAWS